MSLDSEKSLSVSVSRSRGNLNSTLFPCRVYVCPENLNFSGEINSLFKHPLIAIEPRVPIVLSVSALDDGTFNNSSHNTTSIIRIVTERPCFTFAYLISQCLIKNNYFDWKSNLPLTPLTLMLTLAQAYLRQHKDKNNNNLRLLLLLLTFHLSTLSSLSYKNRPRM